ncbi:hypothetical protein JCM8202v2_000555 [Rhodotorula sphaerocarpa]
MPGRGVAAVAARQQADSADGRLSASDSEEFPVRDTAADEREKLASAVARGKSVLWPATLIATLGVGVVSSAAGIIKTRNLPSSFYFNLFIATLVGWSVLLAIQVLILNELHTERKTRNPKVVLALALAFGGWVIAYPVIVLVLVLLKGSASGTSGAKSILLLQAILGVGGSLVAFGFYLQGYVNPVWKAHPHLEETKGIRQTVAHTKQMLDLQQWRHQLHDPDDLPPMALYDPIGRS